MWCCTTSLFVVVVVAIIIIIITDKNLYSAFWGKRILIVLFYSPVSPFFFLSCSCDHAHQRAHHLRHRPQQHRAEVAGSQTSHRGAEHTAGHLSHRDERAPQRSLDAGGRESVCHKLHSQLPQPRQGLHVPGVCWLGRGGEWTHCQHLPASQDGWVWHRVSRSGVVWGWGAKSWGLSHAEEMTKFWK